MNTELPKAEMLMQQVFSISSTASFIAAALSVFRFQYHHNPLYQSYCNLLHKTPENVHLLCDLPFLPISFFKTYQVTTTVFAPELVFESSGTTGQATSKHLVQSADLYRQSCRQAFTRLYGPLQDYCFLGLLPSYLERGQSSLVFMVNDFIEQSGHPQSQFYLHNFESLAQVLQQLEAAGQQTLLIGVTYALLDFASQYPMPLEHTMVMETGGMKGRKKEMVRSEVHEFLQTQFSLPAIHSEYGMTELLSQAYAKKEGCFVPAPWMKVLVRQEDDPLMYTENSNGKTGLINVIDLANIFSCSFIATDDMGTVNKDGHFTVLGRADHSDIRGCSLMAV